MPAITGVLRLFPPPPPPPPRQNGVPGYCGDRYFKGAGLGCQQK